MEVLGKLWSDEQGQDIAEYAVVLAVIPFLVVGTLRLIGTNANNAFSSAASSISENELGAVIESPHGWPSI